MKNLITATKTYLIKVFSDLHNAIVGAIVAAAILGGGGIYLYAQQLWLRLKNIALSPTPLWITILMLFALSVYMIFVRYHSKITEPNQPPPNQEEIIKSIPEESIKVLKVIAETEEMIAQELITKRKTVDKARLLNAEWISLQLKTSVINIQYHFDRLNTAKLIHFYPNRDMDGTTARGRALLHEKGLLP